MTLLCFPHKQTRLNCSVDKRRGEKPISDFTSLHNFIPNPNPVAHYSTQTESSALSALFETQANDNQTVA